MPAGVREAVMSQLEDLNEEVHVLELRNQKLTRELNWYKAECAARAVEIESLQQQVKMLSSRKGDSTTALPAWWPAALESIRSLPPR